jgi:hypothetical protein
MRIEPPFYVSFWSYSVSVGTVCMAVTENGLQVGGPETNATVPQAPVMTSGAPVLGYTIPWSSVTGVKVLRTGPIGAALSRTTAPDSPHVPPVQEPLVSSILIKFHSLGSALVLRLSAPRMTNMVGFPGQSPITIEPHQILAILAECISKKVSPTVVRTTHSTVRFAFWFVATTLRKPY